MRRQGEAARPISRTPGKARRPVVALGPDAERDARLPELGKAFDALVQATAAGEALAEGLARRCHELWLEHQDRIFEWRPTEIRAAGKVVLAADARFGRFIVPAYGAGLRALAIRERSVPRDLLRFARELAALVAGELAPDQFAYFIFSSGLLGFDTAQAESAEEIGQSLLACEHDAAEVWREHSSRAVAQWNELALCAQRSSERGSACAHWLGLLQRYGQSLEQGALALDAETAERLRTQADDPAAFGAVETALWLEQPQLRAALPASHLAFRLRDWIEAAEYVGPQLFERIEALIAASDMTDPDEPIDPGELGAALADKLLHAGLPPEAWPQFAERVQPALFEGALAQLRALAQQSEAARAALAALAPGRGAR